MGQTIRQPRATTSDPHEAAEELIRRLAATGDNGVRLWMPSVLSLAALLVAVVALVIALVR
jgi:hypothetical protein